MKKIFLIILCYQLFLFLETGCNSDGKSGAENAEIEKEKAGREQNSIGKDAPLLKLPKQVAVNHIFSDPQKEDLFVLRSQGNKLEDAILHFTITSSSGEELYAEDFKAALLADITLVSDNAGMMEQEMASMVVNRMNSFFEEANFSVPAIGDDSDFSEEYSDREIWNELLKDKTSVGFYYLHGMQNGKSIAWSKKQKKVVTYFSCC